MAEAMRPTISRRQILRLGGWTAAGLALVPWGAARAGQGEHEPAMGAVHDPDEALRLLLAGNRRWASGQSTYPHQSAARRAEVATGQQPLALVFSCVDSRVPPELV